MVTRFAVLVGILGIAGGCQGFAGPFAAHRSTAFGIAGASATLDPHRCGSPPRILPRAARAGARNTGRHGDRRGRSTRRSMASGDDAAFLSDDPFVVLGLDAPTADKKVIKRAYKKRALKYHPDVVTDVHSTPEEKKKASDRFAKINGAYEQLMGGSKGAGDSGSGSGTAGASGGYTPPHRRSNSGYSSSSSSSAYGDGGGASTDWRDYMPNYRKEDDAQYDTGGDSFGQIFSDMLTGAAGAAVSGGIGGLGGGIFSEFLDFLEGGAGMGTGGPGGSENDPQLEALLRTGTLEDVAEEMDDTEMVVRQLERKARDLDNEVFATDAEAKMAARFSERLEKEERASELKARQEVVGGYLARARKRLLALQTRYKDLIAYGGQNDGYAEAGGRRRSGASSPRGRPSASGSYGSAAGGGPSSGSGNGASSSSTSSSSSSSSTSSKSDDENAWMNEGFGSSSGRRGSGRRGSGRRRSSSTRGRASTSTEAPAPSPSPSPSPSYSASPRPAPGPERVGRTTAAPSSSITSNGGGTRSNYSSDVPPHRRTRGSSFASRQEEDRQRMREVKVDEEFEKLKKELGL
ncbi:unnamed protein product [Pseudo-nitzschia multistriata]|uniref:J domain-containing protein n=1 Tax=Pseudo-nitzschia multistriata TaxID=183589 RepID=A0A448ZSP7_9STRA|nr:unnamed protein product [Pseudo-nitzschia multistriata]